MDFLSILNLEKTLIWVFLIPFIGAFAAYFAGKSSAFARNLIAIFIPGITTVMCAMIFLGSLQGVLSWELKLFLDYGLYLRVDVWGAFMALLSSFIWFLASAFSITYMDHESNKGRYYFFLLLTLGACLSVFLSGDLFTLFVFFEMMSLISYVLVIHSQTEESMSAGRNYLYLSVFGGLMLLTGTMLLTQATGRTAIAPLMESFAVSETMVYVIAAFLIVGFGIKAGMIPLHIWLPKAHPVAPAPASALLSGIMIKTGAYGIVRVIGMIMTPAQGGESPLWGTSHNLGLFIIGMSILTMFAGAIMALFQTNIKRVLAYSSISQMGYILMGVGSAAYLGYEGTMGFAGFSYHILNHAFFKAGMFMMVGAVYYRTHELEFSRLGGLARLFPVTCGAFFVAAAGIAGVPGFNGYISKTLLHHGIEYVYKYSDSIYLLAAEKMFTITGALTVCYIFRLFITVFFGKRPDNIRDIKPEPFSEKIIFSTFAAAILFLGMFPQTILSKVIVPAANGFVFSSYKVEYLLKQNFVNSTDLMGVAIPITAGLLLLLIMGRFNLFRFRLPGWFSIEKVVYIPFTGMLLNVFKLAGGALERNVEKTYIKSPYSLIAMCAPANQLEKFVDGTYVNAPGNLAGVCRKVSEIDNSYPAKMGGYLQKLAVTIRDYIYGQWIYLVESFKDFFKKIFIGGFRTLIQVDKKPKEGASPITSLANLDTNLIIVIITLIIVLGIAFILQ